MTEARDDAARGRRNLWAVSWTSFLTDLSSEMVLNVLPLYMAGPLGLKANVIGLIEGVAEATSSLLKVFSGWLSDRLRARKWLAVGGYAVSALSKPLFYVAGSGLSVGLVRFLDRVGKGVRTAPRDALLADSTARRERGWAFGLHRAADTAGAVLGLGIALLVVWRLQGTGGTLSAETFRTIVLLSLVPGGLAVVVLAWLARDVPVSEPARRLPISWRGLGRRFGLFVLIVGLFELGNSSDAFIVLLASERGLSVLGVLGMLLTMNLVYALTSTPGGMLSDRYGRRRMILVGWSFYALIYLGLGLAGSGAQVWLLVALYGLYYGLSYGTARALVADLVPGELRGTAYGTYTAVLGLLDVPASVIAGVLWHGVGGFAGFGPSAPFFFGAATAALATLAFALWRPASAPPQPS
ncbi:MAG: MFS transporter [Acidobacteria bacterium]|nr:MAG: MFS transporter [Acidobacteriota bacterium]